MSSNSDSNGAPSFINGNSGCARMMSVTSSPCTTAVHAYSGQPRSDVCLRRMRAAPMGLAAPICDDFNSVLQCRRHDRFHALQQHRRVPLARIRRTIECLSGNNTLGQALHGEIIELAAFDDLHAWRDAVVGKSRATAGSVLVTCHGIFPPTYLQ